MTEFLINLLLINVTVVLLTDLLGADSFLKKVVSFIATRGRMITD